MFGTFRYTLATLVMVSHLWPTWMPWSGAYAVFSFYLLSGYLITLALRNGYGLSFNGCARFLASRCLRIFPPYLVVVACSALLLWSMPWVALQLGGRFHLPSDTLGWLHNLLLFGLQQEPAHIIPAAWSLEIELLFYIAMALLLVRHKSIILLWFGASLALTVVAIEQGFTFEQRYYPLASASLPFSLGALLAINRNFLKPNKGKIAIAALLFIVNIFAAGHFADGPFHSAFYLSLALAAYLLLALAAIDKAALPVWVSKTDDWLGNLSYPVFLCQWLAAWLVMAAIEITYGPALFFLSFFVVNLLAYILHLTVEKRTGLWRAQIKRNAAKPSSINTQSVPISP